MLRGAKGLVSNPATLAAFGIGCVAAIISRGPERPAETQVGSTWKKMVGGAAARGATARIVSTKLADVAGATLTRLPSPINGGNAAAVKATELWKDRPAVLLVLRRPG